MNALKVLMMAGCFPLMLSAREHKGPERLNLNDGWEFSQVGTGEWQPACVPGTVHQDLITQGKLPDPFYGTNEQRVQWVEQEDWAYRTVFQVTSEQLARDAARLSFEGLDTYADIYLNGALLEHTDNMFVEYSFSVKALLREGENRLQVLFRSPLKQVLPQVETNGFDYPSDNEHGEKRVSAYTRKAPYSYGWDWGIRLVTSGIWRPVSLTFYDVARINDCWMRQVVVSREQAQTDNRLTVDCVADVPQEAEVTVSYVWKGEEQATVRKVVTLQPGVNEICFPMKIQNPRLWMPNGWGEPALYDVSVQVTIDNQLVASREERIGFRTIQVVREKDEQGESFYFTVNGIPMFAKGVNFIPDDALLPRVTQERYQRLMQDVKEANMNMIRVWGGGIYEDDAFYRAADENGILVWQDFIFACSTYPSDPTFLKRVEAEAAYNIKRLRNHASLAMWCGNNEVYEGLRYWGWKRRYVPTVMEEMMQGYDKLFQHLLPDQLAELDPDRFYLHSSPCESSWGRPNSWKVGDTHNWGIWHGRKPFESLDKEIPRFMSEFGFQSFPEMKTIRTFAAPEDYALDSEVMTAHQKAKNGNAFIKEAMERYYKVPEDFGQLVYMSQVLQGMGVRRGLEAHRRNRPYCMGTLFWQLNDSWPVVSWSSQDYFGNWKALLYQARRAFAPVLVNAIKTEGDWCVYILSDRLEDIPETTLQLRLMDFNGKVLDRRDIKGNVPANASTLYYKVNYEELASRPCDTFLRMTLREAEGDVLSDETYYFNPAKDLNLPKAEIRCKVKPMNGRCEVILSSDRLARDVFLEISIQGARFSDNFFDLLPGQTKKVVITSDQLRKKENVEIKITQLSDITNQYI